MAKAKCLLESELEDADLMTILSNGGSSNIFKKNDMIDYYIQQEYRLLIMLSDMKSISKMILAQ
jgi:hypothetical protein